MSPSIINCPPLVSRIKTTFRGEDTRGHVSEDVRTTTTTRLCTDPGVRDEARAYAVPRAVVILLLALNFNSFVGRIKGVYQLPVRKEESHEIVLLIIGHVQDQTERRVGL